VRGDTGKERAFMTAKTATSMDVPAKPVASAITVRRVPFVFPGDLDPIVVDGCPEESHRIVGVSLILPYLEPYLIRSMRAAREHVRTPQLLADLEAFCAQEGQHYRQHRRFNEAIRLAGIAGLRELEAEVEADYQRYTRTKSLRWNLAYAEGFEAFTMAFARFSLESGALDRVRSPAVRDLFAWHLIEELEHRTVAFDVYEHVCGGYPYRLGVGLFAQWHLGRFVHRVGNAMRSADPSGFRAKYGGRAEARARTRPRDREALTGFVPKVLATYLPWYTPHAIEMTAAAQALADHYAALSASAAAGPRAP
jgi:predicted metal-dependent hydrolase